MLTPSCLGVGLSSFQLTHSSSACRFDSRGAIVAIVGPDRGPRNVDSSSRSSSSWDSNPGFLVNDAKPETTLGALV